MVVFLVLAAYLVLDREHASIDAEARGGAPGKFAQLTDGVTHYDLASASDDGRTVAAFPRAEFHVIEGAGHLPHIEQAAVVDSILLKFLGAGQGGARTP